MNRYTLVYIIVWLTLVIQMLYLLEQQKFELSYFVIAWVAWVGGLISHVLIARCLAYLKEKRNE